jgi:hypothetical protein
MLLPVEGFTTSIERRRLNCKGIGLTVGEDIALGDEFANPPLARDRQIPAPYRDLVIPSERAKVVPNHVLICKGID